MMSTGLGTAPLSSLPIRTLLSAVPSPSDLPLPVPQLRGAPTKTKKKIPKHQNNPTLNGSQLHDSDPEAVVERLSLSLPPFLLARLTPILCPCSRRVLLATASLVPSNETLLGSGKQVALHRPALATCLQLHPGSLDYRCLPSLAAANNWPRFKSLAGKFGHRREGSGKRAGLPCTSWTRSFSKTPRDSPLLAQVKTSQPFPRHPTP